MILEIADIRVHPGQEAAFEEAIQRAVRTVLPKAKGVHGYKVNKCIETPQRFILQIFWETLENHTVDFRQGPLFVEWRSFIGPFLAQPPEVQHFELALESGSPR